MVSDPRDSAGPSPLLTGSPLDAWTEVEQTWALEDAFDKAMQKHGPRFTRQVVRGSRLDQARLDRIYISQDATWCNEERVRLSALKADDGTMIEDEVKLMRTIGDFYQQLYTQPEIQVEDRASRMQALQPINKFATVDENKGLTERPEAKEMGEIIGGMAKGKAPRADGLTVEVLLGTWSWTEQPCMAFVQTVWTECRIGTSNTIAIVKLLPKSQEKLYLRNWRPISSNTQLQNHRENSCL
ncbi:hypothetical protein R1sor_012035 [Riccia sorocarpa]|uniref:Uncharacterized protein n=1 Tax=Riccia sorocarpa TaxID=122646 RepID=A0ABD3I4H6_9MARC